MTEPIRRASAPTRTVRITREQPAVTITLATTTPPRRSHRWIAGAAAGIAGVAALALTASLAGASTVDGVATITSAGTTTALPSGGSTTQFSLTLPSLAKCTADTATGGYHVYSYLVQKGTALSGVTFNNFPSQGYGLVNSVGTYYGAANTAATTGQIIAIPNDFEFAPLVTTDGGSVTLAQLLYTGSGASASGIWEAGLVCANPSNAAVDNWNTEVTFTASAGDANGFVWSAVPGTTTTTTTTTTTSTSTTTTTTTDPNSTTTTTAPNSTTTTTAPVGGSGGGSSTPSDVAASSTTPSSSGGTLAFTGIHTAKGLGVGLLAVGLGLMLLGWGYRKKVVPARRAKKDAGWS